MTAPTWDWTWIVIVVVGMLGIPAGPSLARVSQRMRPPTAVRPAPVAAATGVFFAVVAWWAVAGPGRALLTADGASGPAPVGVALLLIAYLYLAGVSVMLALIDLDTHTLPDRVVLPSYLIGGALLAAAALSEGTPARLLGGVLGLASLGSFYLLLAVLSPAGMGFGDVKLAGLLGLYLGWLGWGPFLVGAAGAFLAGGVVAGLLLATRRVDRGAGIPFGPWMLVGAWAGIVAGTPLSGAYLAAFRFL